MHQRKSTLDRALLSEALGQQLLPQRTGRGIIAALPAKVSKDDSQSPFGFGRNLGNFLDDASVQATGLIEQRLKQSLGGAGIVQSTMSLVLRKRGNIKVLE